MKMEIPSYIHLLKNFIRREFSNCKLDWYAFVDEGNAFYEWVSACNINLDIY